jgi:hypothetical protein
MALHLYGVWAYFGFLISFWWFQAPRFRSWDFNAMIPPQYEYHSTLNRCLRYPFRSASRFCVAIVVTGQRFDSLHLAVFTTGVASSVNMSLSSVDVPATYFYCNSQIFIDLWETTSTWFLEAHYHQTMTQYMPSHYLCTWPFMSPDREP